jgi:uncharacterized protein YbcI
MKSQGEIEAAVCDAVSRFQQEFMGRGPRHVEAHLVDNRLFVHLDGVLTAAEQQLIAGRGAGDGRGAAPITVHHDISPSTGEEVIVITLAAAPACRERKRR